MPKQSPAPQTNWLDKPLLSNIKLNWETGIVALLLIAAIFTRFYGLGDRVMSHDETTHVYFSWQLFKGQGYQHDPLSHGPLQFHLLALSYFLFGDNDFTARAPQALFSVFTVLFVWWGFRRYLGRIGALAAACFFLISPYLLYYGRYARNESWVALFGIIMLWGILRYLDRGENKYLYVTTAALALHFTAKETSFIYAAQALLFLGFLFLIRIGERNWGTPEAKRNFFIVFLLAASLFVLAIGAQTFASEPAPVATPSTEVQEPVVVQGETDETLASADLSSITKLLAGGGVIAFAVSLVLLVRGFGWDRLRSERSFGLLVLFFTLSLPHLAAFPVQLIRPDLPYSVLRGIVLNWVTGVQLSPTDLNAIIIVMVSIVAMFVAAIALGLAWSPREWLINLAIFFAIFIPLYTTMFTNGAGIFTGLYGSLGYWLEQQGVERGSQPAYFYALLQVPMYEFLALFGTIVAGVLGIRLLTRKQAAKPQPVKEERNLSPEESRRMALILLAFWAVTSMLAYTVAGEKMPWLTVHIAVPMLLLAGWTVGWIMKRVEWEKIFSVRSFFAIAAMLVFLVALFNALGSLLGMHPPFAGSTQIQIQDTYRFVFYGLLTFASAYAMLTLPEQAQWKPGQWSKVFLVLIFAGLAFYTARISFRANYLHYDLATEYLVYAHMAPGPKEIMRQLEELSTRLTDSNDIMVAYDNETTYPFWWYLRNYPNQRYYQDQPTRDLRDFPVILVGDTNYGKLEPIVGNSFYMFEYNRIWWPNQDYFEYKQDAIAGSFAADTGLPAEQMGTWDYLTRVGTRLWSYFGNPVYREAIWKIWMDRDFSAYLEAKGQDPSLSAWIPSRTMRMYVRKDIAAQVWEYGAQSGETIVIEDPYEGKGIELAADYEIAAAGIGPGQFNSPRGLAIAPDGSVFVADANNHRIQHFGADGVFLNEWGAFSDPGSGLEGGTFNEPWGVAVSPDGRFVYVADTWNHRIQKFTISGIFLTTWGNFGQDDQPYSMWGPRDLLVDNDGNVLVMDTGNKRIKVYDAEGNFLTQYGDFGFEPGQFNEPVGMALDRQLGRLYVADTWNQRVQVFDYADGIFTPVDSWDIEGWFGQSLVNKPYLSVGELGQVFVTDPEAARILVFTSDGMFVKFFGGYEQTAVEIGIAQAVAADGLGGVWVTDSQNNQILHFPVD
jgi:predicted membrane-bound mannosyltransferase/DNA-binding beta-propeller fold protein YncE